MDPLIDEDTYMALVPLSVARNYLNKASQFREGYCAAHDLLVFNGWGFADPIDGSYIGADPACSDNYTHVAGNDGGTSFELEYYSEQWLLKVPESYGRSLFYDALENMPISMHPTEQGQWEEGVESMLFLLVKANRFRISLLQRITVRMHQHLIAKTLENVFGLDNRGRPVA